MADNKQEIKAKYYLDNLPELLPSPGLISCHGRGKGGGEVVLEKILKLYKQNNITPKTITSKDSFASRVWPILRLKNNDSILLTSGLRDLDVIALCILLRKKFAVYVQVPYLKSCDFKGDLVHYLLVRTYLILIRIFSKYIFVNSAETLGIKSTKAIVLLPVTYSEIVKEKIFLRKLDKSCVVFGTASRLFAERGIGSKDPDGLIDICLRTDKILGKKGIEFKIVHFGEVDIQIANSIRSRFNKIEFCGYNKHWTDADVDLFIFNSRYEGFGLAPLEASAKKPVFVNEAFPEELLACSPNIYPINDLFGIL